MIGFISVFTSAGFAVSFGDSLLMISLSKEAVFGASSGLVDCLSSKLTTVFVVSV